MTNLLIAGLIALALASGWFLGWQGRKFIGRLEALELAVQKRTLPARAKDGLEDLMAIGNDIRFQNWDVDQVIGGLITTLLKSEAVRHYTDERVDQLLTIAKQLRSDPHGYDPDQPNQKKNII